MKTEDRLCRKIINFAEKTGADPEDAAYAMMVCAASLIPYQMKKQALSLFASILDEIEECQKEVYGRQK